MKGLIDSTLREGGQMVGVNFTLAEKLNIVRGLDRIGIEEIEVGIATGNDQELPEVFRDCRAGRIKARLALWSRCLAKDIDLAAGLLPDVLSLSIPGSDLHIEKKLGRDRAWVLTRVNESVKRARTRGLGYISLGIEDATRSDPAFLEKIIIAAQRAGVDRIRLADTVGVATPAELTGLLGRLRKVTPLPLGVHCHNDFGMASANTISALECGADWGDVTVYGIGERAGNARLEEVAAHLVLRGGGHYRLRELKELAGLVAGCCGKDLDPHRPVVGERIFQCETGLHLQGLEADAATYEPYPPEAVGSERKLFYGGKIGRRHRRRLNSGLRPGLPSATTADLSSTIDRIMAALKLPWKIAIQDSTFHG